MKSSAQSAAESAKGAAHDVTSSGKSAAESMKSSAQSAAESAKGAAHDVTSSAQSAAESAKQENKDKDIQISGSPEIKERVIIQDQRIIKDEVK
jgi:type IV secretory pathway TrbL component